MQRKWTMLAAMVISVSMIATGLSMAQDEASPLHKLMEQVNKNNLVITKGVRTKPAFKKGQPAIVESAEELAKLVKKARDLGEEPVKKQNKPEASLEKWKELADTVSKEATKFAAFAGKSSTSQEKAKVAYKAVSKACTSCHTVFRVDEP